MRNKFDTDLLDFITANPTPYHVIATQADELSKNGYQRLFEHDPWTLEYGKKYYITRNDSAIIAFQIPKNDWLGYSICASHSDSPCFSIKENPELTDNIYTRLNTELYGGAIRYSWLDRPLGIGGRLCVKDGNNIKSILTDAKRDLVMIPSLAIHMDRTINDGKKFSSQKDLIPLFKKTGKKSLISILAESANVNSDDILGFDLVAYNRQPYCFWGASDEFISGPRLDDCMCAYASFMGFLASSPTNKASIHAVFDNEEVGSSTRQGAASTFLKDTLKRISGAFDKCDRYMRDISSSFMLSADNAHAFHPNHPEKCDLVNRPVLGGGVVVKFSASRRYSTDGLTAAKVRLLAKNAGINLQTFVNHSDIPSGSTLGNISGNQIPVPCADIGLAQLAMHSAYETAGSGDAEQLMKLAKQLFSE